MNFPDFDAFTESLFNEVRKMRDTKGKEYARSLDRFDNFNRLAAKLSLPRLKVWHVYFTKHMDAIDSYIDKGRTLSNESIRGRFVDAITYLTLGLGMITEDQERNKNANRTVKHGRAKRLRKAKTRSSWLRAKRQVSPGRNSKETGVISRL